jgi:DNA polymerase
MTLTLESTPVVDTLVSKIKSCELCALCKTRTNAVPGYGNWNADVMFIGEGPGRDEDLQGLPFVGAAGRVLNEMLSAIGWTREDVFITNVVKCRPPNNRDPLVEEVKKCWPYLEAQIKIIKPKLIVTLGRHSMNRFMPGLKISEVHGELKKVDGFFEKTLSFLPLYHPAASLYDPRKKSVLLEDFKKIPLILKKINDSS